MIDNPMMFVRSLKGAPASVLLGMILTRQTMTVTKLCTYTGYKSDAIREAVLVLSGYELIHEGRRAHGESFYTVGEGIQFLLPGIDPTKTESDLILICPNDDPNQNRIKTDSGDTDEVINHQNSLQNRIKTDSESQKEGSIMMMIDDSISFKNNHHQSEPGPKLETVLESLDLLFGDNLDIEDVGENVPVNLALAWIVKTYHDRHNLNNPIGLIKARLRARSKRSLPKDWQERLPNSYLAAIGFVTDPTPTTSEEEYYSAALDQQQTDQEEAEDPEPVRLWKLALNQLGLPATTKYIGRVHPLSWHNDCLILAAESEPAADYLENRLAVMVAKAVSGIVNAPANVTFVFGG